MTKQNKMLPKTNKQKIKVREMKQKDIQMLTMESRKKKKKVTQSNKMWQSHKPRICALLRNVTETIKWLP